MKRIMHVLNSTSKSGAESVAIQIIRYCMEDYEGIYVSPDGEIGETLSDKGITYIPIKKMSLSLIRRAIETYNPDLIHAHDFTTSILCSFCSRKIPIISHLHHNAPWIRAFNYRTVLYRISAVNYKYILLVSEVIYNQFYFKRLMIKKGKVIGNPINKNEIIRLAGCENKVYDVIFCGRLESVKDPLRFLRIIKQITMQRPHIKVVIVGTGSLENEVTQKVLEYRLESVVDCVGYQENPYTYILKSKVMLITSKWEGYGLTTREAFVLGVPVVSTKAGDIQSVITNDNGMCFENDEEAVCEISKLLTDEKYYESKRQSCERSANKIEDIDAYMKSIKEIYSAVLD